MTFEYTAEELEALALEIRHPQAWLQMTPAGPLASFLFQEIAAGRIVMGASTLAPSSLADQASACQMILKPLPVPSWAHAAKVSRGTLMAFAIAESLTQIPEGYTLLRNFDRYKVPSFP